jgi:hypothetical protein
MFYMEMGLFKPRPVGSAVGCLLSRHAAFEEMSGISREE